jgi:hypothetical protein
VAKLSGKEDLEWFQDKTGVRASGGRKTAPPRR